MITIPYAQPLPSHYDPPPPTPHHPHLHMDRGLWLEITGTKRYSMVSNTILY